LQVLKNRNIKPHQFQFEAALVITVGRFRKVMCGVMNLRDVESKPVGSTKKTLSAGHEYEEVLKLIGM